MRKNIYINYVIFLMCFFGFSQATLYKVEIEEQLENATVVVEAEVLEKESYRSKHNNHIYTLNTLKVLGIYKGELLANQIQVVTKGGSIGFDREVHKPSLQLRTNDIGFFILKETENQFEGNNSSICYKPTHGMQSFFEYDLRSDNAFNPFYSYDSIENFQSVIKQYATIDYTLIESFSIQSASAKSLDIIIRSIAPTDVRAGIGEEISIIGEGFGNTQGTIDFPNSDNGGFSTFTAFDSAITSWSDTNIIVKIPSLAGSGNIIITTNEGEQLTSTRTLNILSSEVNAEFSQFPGEEFRARFVNDDRNGGYTWTFNEGFSQNADAVDAFTRSVQNWVCETNISWLISNNVSSITEAVPDGINLISFKNPNQSNQDDLEPGVLAVTTTYYSGCASRGNVISFVDEIDITFTEETRAISWHFTEDDPSFNDFDFQGTATHELGHAHNLGHVIAPNNLMHFETSQGINSATREIDADSSIGATESFDFSKILEGTCNGERTVVSRNCNDTMELLEDGEIRIITFNDGFLQVLTGNMEPIISLTVYDLAGRAITRSTLDNEINIAGLSKGVYIIFIEEASGSTEVRKFINP